MATSDTGLQWLRDLYEEEHPRLWRALLGYTRSAAIADDAAAEAFARAALRTDLHSPAAWVWRVAFRVAGRELARERRFGPAATETADSRSDATRLSAETLDLLDALRELTPQQSGSLVLTRGFHLSAEEAGDILGTSAASVRVQSLRARRTLRHRLASDPSPEGEL